MKVEASLADDELLHCCWLAYLSDDLPVDCVVRSYRRLAGADWEPTLAASLDHTIWFHHRPRVDRWHLYDFTASALVGGRGLAIGKVYADDGLHIATVAQEVLLRGSFPVGGADQPD